MAEIRKGQASVVNEEDLTVQDVTDIKTQLGIKDVKFIDGTDPLDAVYNDGNVGIGTDGPTAKLDIVNTNPLLPYLKLSSSGNKTGDIFQVDENGKVGIGITNPSYDIDIYAISPFIHLKRAGGNQRGVFAADGGGVLVGSFSNDFLRFFVNSIVVGYINKEGNWGIGHDNTNQDTIKLIYAKLEVLNEDPLLDSFFVSSDTNTPGNLFKVDKNGCTIFQNITEANRLAIVTPNLGSLVYQTDGTEGVYVYKSTGWVFAY